MLNLTAITIRPATQADLPAIVAIYNQSVVTKQATADLIPVTVKQQQDWFNKHTLEKNRPLLVATRKVAVDNKATILGWATLSNLYERPAYRISAEISVYIDENVTGQGIGKMLVEQQLALAPSCNVQRALAKIFAHNQPSLNLFEKLGFEEWGRLEQVCDMDGFIADVVILGKAV